jgi:hypothetical protein
MLQILNTDRAALHLPPLHLKARQSMGVAGCSGSLGHSTAMARSGQIWHVNPSYPHASFPRNLCVGYTVAAENVGASSSGSSLGDLEMLNRMMMQEPHSSATCGSTVNHACNIINRAFRHVGIGIYLAGGITWLTEDFVT